MSNVCILIAVLGIVAYLAWLLWPVYLRWRTARIIKAYKLRILKQFGVPAGIMKLTDARKEQHHD